MPHTGLAISRDLANFTNTGCMRSICRPLTSCTSALGGRLTTLDHPPTQLDPPEPARLPRAAPRTGIPQRGLRACHGSGESSLEAAWPPPVAPPQPPNTASARPQHPREQPRHRRRSSAHGATCQHSERACERHWTRAKERAGSSSENGRPLRREGEVITRLGLDAGYLGGRVEWHARFTHIPIPPTVAHGTS